MRQPSATLRAAHALFAACCVAFLCAAGQGPEKLVIYANEDNARVRIAIEHLRAELLATPGSARHNIRLEHLVVEVSRIEETEQRIRAVLARRPAIIIAPNGPLAAVVKSVTSDVPVLFASYQDPFEFGLVASLAHPGGNLTGFTRFLPIDQKRLEMLREVAPRARRLGVIVDHWWSEEAYSRLVKEAAKSVFGFAVEEFRAETLEELRAAIDSPRGRGVDAWFIPYTSLPFNDPQGVVTELARTRKPAVYPRTQFVEMGGLMAYQQNLADANHLWATMVGLVLDGIAPAEIPVERPKSFELAVNLGTARSIGVVLPGALLRRSDSVY